MHCVDFVCFSLHTCSIDLSRLFFSLLTVLHETPCQGKGEERRSVTLNPHPSHSAPSLEPKSFDLFMLSSISLIYQKAKMSKMA